MVHGGGSDVRAGAARNDLPRRTVALVGAGSRGLGMFLKPLVEDFNDVVSVTALCDNNRKRAAGVAARAGVEIPVYGDFDEMLSAIDPDGVIVASRDCTHGTFITRALAADKFVFCEKPICTTVEDCHAIRAAEKRSTARCLATHNMRYGASSQAIHEIIHSGRLGDVFFIRFEETLDRCHGADYFRRWHRRMSESGGLLIHKASHHFDILNWWTGSRAAMVSAMGRLAFYGSNGPFRHQRCLGCPHAAECDFYWDLPRSKESAFLYLEAETEDGYFRDGCVFDPKIDIYDQMNAVIEYDNGIHVSYSLTAYSPYESETVIVEGSKGRLEYRGCYDTGWASGGQALPGIEQMAGDRLTLYLAGKGVETIPVKRGKGSHGGSDLKLREDFFRRDWTLPPNDRMATLEDAVQAVLVGAAANRSIETGQPVRVQEL